jgi:concanavalin A-like lectin/glucanase superfamily protein
VAVWERPLSQLEINQMRTNGMTLPINAAAPVMVADPVGNTNLLVGEFFALRGFASGVYPRTYQWYKDGVALVDDAITVIGSTSNTLALPILDATNSGAYSVVIANSQGSVTSAPAALLIGTVVPQTPNLTNGQISYWPLDSVSGITVPDVVRGYDMLLLNGMGASNLVAGKWGNAMKFYTNGIGMMSRTHNPSDALPIVQYPDFTISAWVNAPAVNNGDGSVTATGGGRRIFTECRNDSSQPTFSLANGDNNSTPRGPVDKLRSFIRNDNNQNNADAGASTLTAYDETWHHVVYRQRWVGGALPMVEASWYVDGVKDTAFIAHSPRLPLSMQNSSIGGQNRAAALGFQFIGLIDDVAVWKRALTDQEIVMLSTNVTPAAPPVVPELIITSFRGAFAEVVNGDSMLLSWNVAGLTGSGLALSIDQGIGDVLAKTTNGIGTLVVSGITTSKTYTLTAQRTTNSVSAQTTVTVVNGVAAGWTVLDNFQAYSAGPLVNPYWSDLRGGSTVEDLSGNHMLNTPSGSGGEGQVAVLPLSTIAVAPNQGRTLFARVYVQDDPAATAMFNDIGLTDKTLRTHNDMGTDTGPLVRLYDDPAGDLAIGAFNAVGGPNTLTPRKLEQGQVYNVWIDITNRAFTATDTGDSFSIWIQRLGESGRILIASNYNTDRDLLPDFLGPTLVNLDKLVVANGAASGTVYIDDIYLSKTGFNSTTPVAWLGPTPPTLAVPVLDGDITSVPGSIIFTWDAGPLMYADALTGPWRVVVDAYGLAYVLTLDQSVPKRFYRLQR